MSQKNKTQRLISRRQTLLGGTAGLASLAAWQKPLLESVVLPAHAQTSGAFATSYYGGGVTSTLVTKSTPLDLFIKTAVAGERMGEPDFFVGAERVNATTYNVGILHEPRFALRSGNLNIDGSMGVLPVTEIETECEGPPMPRAFNAYIADITLNTITIHFDTRDGDFLQVIVDAGEIEDLSPTYCEDSAEEEEEE